MSSAESPEHPLVDGDVRRSLLQSVAALETRKVLRTEHDAVVANNESESDSKRRREIIGEQRKILNSLDDIGRRKLRRAIALEREAS